MPTLMEKGLSRWTPRGSPPNFAEANGRSGGTSVYARATDEEDALLDHDGEEDGWGTVGAVALDVHGHVAAATSPGHDRQTARRWGYADHRSGTWADASVAVSCTGVGEAFIRTVAAHSVAVHHQHTSLEEAAERVLNDVAPFGGAAGSSPSTPKATWWCRSKPCSCIAGCTVMEAFRSASDRTSFNHKRP